MVDKKATILIIDDEVEICLNMKDMLGYEDMTADYATNAKEAFQKIEEDGHELLLVDIKLEGLISGIDIIKTFSGKAKRPKIIVISAIPRDALNPSFEKKGIMNLMDAYLDKPSCSNPDNLMQTIRRVLGQTKGA
ncbi:MAG: response regulator [Chlamydiota bacterium]|nr:response regulator [Chlamydiota bacterium]